MTKKRIVLLTIMVATAAAIAASCTFTLGTATTSSGTGWESTGGPLDYSKGSANGKYETILDTLSVPADKDKYGDLYELGYQNKTSYRGYENLPTGYWVYAYPHWYIWKIKAGDTVEASLDYTKAAVNGKYETILKTFSVAADKARYGDLYDLGYQSRTAYGTNKNLPTGYWVYAYPYWYIWKTKVDDTGASLDYGRASVRGKYETILKTFSVPTDKDRYGDLYDLGYQDRTTYGTNRNLPAGYWVYADPYWYIWKTEVGETGGSLDYTKAAVKGKYETILKTFSVPADRDRYGDLYDLGYQNKTSYGANGNLPAGYWVYAYPYWYIWKTKVDDTEGSLDYRKASVRGKYETILKTFSVPADKDRYGDLYDLGYQNKTSYGANRNLPAGYWVYAYPYWYIWEDMKGSSGPGPEPTVGPTPEEKADPSSAYGKYYNLKKEISAPLDIVTFGNYYEKGYSTDRQYGSIQDLPAGYWVYVFPTWYIWEKQRDTENHGGEVPKDLHSK